MFGFWRGNLGLIPDSNCVCQTDIFHISIFLKRVSPWKKPSCGKLIVIHIFWDCPVVESFHHLAPSIPRTSRQDHSLFGGSPHISQSFIADSKVVRNSEAVFFICLLVYTYTCTTKIIEVDGQKLMQEIPDTTFPLSPWGSSSLCDISECRMYLMLLTLV